jgi:hypothetical protein
MDMLRKSLAVLLAVTMATPALAAEVKLNSALTGGSADPDGSGTFSATADTDKNQLCYELSVKDIGTAMAAHIHKGAAGTNGGPVVSLEAPGSGSSKACASVEADVLSAIIADPAGYYVNVHTAEFRGGAIRGQLSI